MNKPYGSIIWKSLIVKDASALAEFYSQVVGWRTSLHDMETYHDFNVMALNGEVVTGICHARGSNAGVPGQWLLYVLVEDLEECLRTSAMHGGTVVHGPRMLGHSKMAVIQDPDGAILGLISA